MPSNHQGPLPVASKRPYFTLVYICPKTEQYGANSIKIVKLLGILQVSLSRCLYLQPCIRQLSLVVTCAHYNIPSQQSSLPPLEPLPFWTELCIQSLLTALSPDILILLIILPNISKIIFLKGSSSNDFCVSVVTKASWEWHSFLPHLYRPL